MGNDQTHVVAIITEGYSCTVVPIDLLVQPGHIVYFQNLTDSVSQMFFPNASLFGSSVIDLDPGQKIAMTVGNVEYGSYGYTVFYKGEQQFGDKAARPRIIVYRTIP